MIEIIVEELVLALALIKNKGIEIEKISFKLNSEIVIEIKQPVPNKV